MVKKCIKVVSLIKYINESELKKKIKKNWILENGGKKETTLDVTHTSLLLLYN